MMGVRADITPQVARIDAHLLNRKGVTRLCYCGSVLHARPATPAASREPIQVGAEMFGQRGVAGDLEIQALLCRALAAAGVKGARMDVGHVAVFRSLVQAAGIGHELEVDLFEALQKKDVAGLKNLARGTDAKTRSALVLLPDLYGGAEVLDLAEKKLPPLFRDLRFLAGPASSEVWRDLLPRCAGMPPRPWSHGRSAFAGSAHGEHSIGSRDKIAPLSVMGFLPRGCLRR